MQKEKKQTEGNKHMETEREYGERNRERRAWRMSLRGPQFHLTQSWE